MVTERLQFHEVGSSSNQAPLGFIALCSSFREYSMTEWLAQPSLTGCHHIPAWPHNRCPSTIVPVLRLRLLILFRPLLLLKEQESKALDDWLLSSVPPSKLSTGRAFASYSIADLNAHVSRFWLQPGCHQPSVFVLRVAGTERSRSGTCHLRVSTRLFIECTRAS